MARLIVYYAHPGHNHSRVNQAMYSAAQNIKGIDVVDLYAEYPRYHINVDREQQRLIDHDVVLFQFPLFWYSVPALLKEWIDLVLEYGFAYGEDGTKLGGKTWLCALTAAGPEDAYTTQGYQHYPLRTFLTPLERTAGLCHMQFAAPYVLYGSLTVDEAAVQAHVEGYQQLLEAIRDDHFDLEKAIEAETLDAHTLPGVLT